MTDSSEQLIQRMQNTARLLRDGSFQIAGGGFADDLESATTLIRELSEENERLNRDSRAA